MVKFKSHLMDKYLIMNSINVCKQIFVNKREYLNQFLLAKTIKWNKPPVEKTHNCCSNTI